MIYFFRPEGWEAGRLESGELGGEEAVKPA